MRLPEAVPRDLFRKELVQKENIRGRGRENVGRREVPGGGKIVYGKGSRLHEQPKKLISSKAHHDSSLAFGCQDTPSYGICLEPSGVQHKSSGIALEKSESYAPSRSRSKWL